jgi:LacI family transcriptional regulator
MATSERRRRPGSARVTLKRIAEDADLPIMTVSRALRGLRGEVSEETRRRVLAVAERLGYRPNLLVRAIQTGRSQNIGVVLPPISTFTYQVLCGIHDELVLSDCLPLVHWQRSDPASGADAERQAELEVIHRLLDRRVDGVILFSNNDWVFDLHTREIGRRDIPLVAVDRFLKRSRTDFVGTDDALGARLAAGHLLALGHRLVAQITGEDRLGPFHDRRRAFAATIAAGGGTCVDYELGKAELANLAATARELLASAPRPTAVFLGADHFAPEFYAVARSFRLSIPRDLSVVGFADLDVSQYLSPPLTTLRQQPYTLGQEAARLVLRRCTGGGDKPVVIRLRPELVVRGSTQAPTAT